MVVTHNCWPHCTVLGRRCVPTLAAGSRGMVLAARCCWEKVRLETSAKLC